MFQMITEFIYPKKNLGVRCTLNPLSCMCSQGRLPVKWTAYEALMYGTYTTQSDV